MNNKTFDDMPIPLGGAVPFEPGIIREERRPETHSFTDKTKARVNRNFNESPLVRLYSKDRITQNQYGAAIMYMEAYFKAYPTQSHEYKARVDGGGYPDRDYSLAAEDRILAAGRIMDPVRYKALQMFVIDECEPSELGAKFGRGWGRKSVDKRIGEFLDELSEIWPQTKVKAEYVA